MLPNTTAYHSKPHRTIQFVDTQDNDLMSIEETAELSGYSVHSLRKFCQRGEMPFVQRTKGAVLRFRRSDVLSWMEGDWKPAEPAA